MNNQIYFIYGQGLVVLDDTVMKELQLAGNFFIKELLPRHKSLEVEVSVSNKLDYNAQGYTTDYGHPIYSIELKKQSIDKMLITLAHEIVHVKQMVRKEVISETEAYDKEVTLFNKYKETFRNK